MTPGSTAILGGYLLFVTREGGIAQSRIPLALPSADVQDERRNKRDRVVTCCRGPAAAAPFRFSVHRPRAGGGVVGAAPPHRCRGNARSRGYSPDPSDVGGHRRPPLPTPCPDLGRRPRPSRLPRC